MACDGRDSRLRAESGLPLHRYDVPLDVEWFRVPRHEGDPDGGLGRMGRGRFMVLLDRGDYYQCALIIGKGTDARLRSGPIQTFRDFIEDMNPWMAGRLDAIASWDEVKLLEVSLDRLRRWSAPGLLCIGDAAHAMSPVGGVGINLAIQDAVAAGRALAGPLRAGDAAAVATAASSVQRRRTFPTLVTQTLQDLAHRRVLAPLLSSEAWRGSGTPRSRCRSGSSTASRPCSGCRPGWWGSARCPSTRRSSRAGRRCRSPAG